MNAWMDEAFRMDSGGLKIRTLRYICSVFGHRSFALEDFLREAPQDAPPAVWHIGLVQLCQDRTVRMMRKTWGERLYQVPVFTFLQKFEDGWPEVLRLAGDEAHREGRILLGDARRAMSEQVLAAIIALELEPLELTRQGKLHKRSLERMKESLLWSSGWTGEMLGRLLAETLDLLLRMELARRSDRLIKLDEPRVREWLRLDAARREEQMFLIWYGVHGPDQPGLHWLTGAVLSQSDGSYLPLARLLEIGHEHGIRLDEQAAQDWLLRLHAAGWLELGTDEIGGRWVRRRQWPEPSARTLIAQQDCEIIALPDTGFEVVRMLHQIGERLDWQEVQRYRLTRQSIRMAAERGWKPEEIIGFLRHHALDELPALLEASIRQWAEEQSGIRVYAGTVLKVLDRRASNVLDCHRRELPFRQLNDRYWLAEGLSGPEVMKLLEDRGIAAILGPMTQDQQETCEPEASLSPAFTLSVEEALRPGAPGLFTPRYCSALYREEQPSSLLEEVYPEYRKIPSSWYEQYRRYHHSTAKQLIEQAMRWRTGVRLRIADEDRVVVPHALERKAGVWMLEGRAGSKPVSIRLEEIEQLKLLAPGLME